MVCQIFLIALHLNIFQLLPSSIDLLCSNLEDCDSSTLDDIEQVLKDAENFDILA